jgi:AraC family transcriptional regulator of adaptative response / DNA-3-methyladenine glycosylase II
VELNTAVYDAARRSRDARFDGRFFIGVTTTRVYCRPICPVPAPKDEHILYFPTAAAAEGAGFRPCLRCRPESSPGTPAWSGTSAIVSRGLRLIGEGALDEGDIEQFAASMGVTARHLRRLFVRHLGATPTAVAATRRLHFAKKLIDETGLRFTDVAAGAGFGSLRRFNGVIRATYGRTPTKLRRLARQRAGTGAEPDCYRFKLTYRPPYDWDAMLAFLRARAIPHVELVEGACYRRTIAIDGAIGTIAVSPVPDAFALALEVRLPRPSSLLTVVDRVRRIFDVTADPAVVVEHLRKDPLLDRVLARHPGLRVPGAWDGFELAVRAVLGQQISVAAASTIAGRIAEDFGTPVPGPDTFDRAFPGPEQLAEAPLERCGVMTSRADTIRRLSRAVASGAITLKPSSDPAVTVAALQRLPGIGEWTAQYIAMRALGEPDALPVGDLVLRREAAVRTAAELEQRSRAWRPWRAYAVISLWQGAGNSRADINDMESGRRKKVGRPFAHKSLLFDGLPGSRSTTEVKSAQGLAAPPARLRASAAPAVAGKTRT